MATIRFLIKKDTDVEFKLGALITEIEDPFKLNTKKEVMLNKHLNSYFLSCVNFKISQ